MDLHLFLFHGHRSMHQVTEGTKEVTVVSISVNTGKWLPRVPRYSCLLIKFTLHGFQWCLTYFNTAADTIPLSFLPRWFDFMNQYDSTTAIFLCGSIEHEAAHVFLQRCLLHN